MFIIRNWVDRDNEINDVVETYDDLVNYFKKLMEMFPALKMINEIPTNPPIGRSNDILKIPDDRTYGIHYYFERFEFVKEPTDVDRVSWEVSLYEKNKNI